MATNFKSSQELNINSINHEPVSLDDVEILLQAASCRKYFFFLKMPTLSRYSCEIASTHLGQGLSRGCLHPGPELESISE